MEDRESIEGEDRESIEGEDSEDEDGLTALHRAVLAGDFEAVAKEVANGRVVNQADYDGFTPLHSAALKGFANITTFLLDHHADAGAVTDTGTTALHLASCSGCVTVMESLLSKGVSMNMENHNGVTPLHNACRTNHLDAAKWLVEQGAAPNTLNAFGESPLSVVTKHGHQAIVSFLRSLDKLHKACEAGDLESVQRLAGSGESVNMANAQGEIPLHISSSVGSEAIVECLVSHGADVDSRSVNGARPLHLAVQNHHQHVFKRLIELGAAVHLCDDEGVSPFHMLCQNEELEMIQFLRDKRIFCSCDQDKCTSLTLASSQGNLSVLRYLLEQKHSNKLLDECLLLACDEGHFDIVRYLVEHGAHVDFPDKGEILLNEPSPLHCAASGGYLDIVKYLVMVGADLNYTAAHLNIPIQDACEAGHLDVVSYLAEHQGMNCVDLALFSGCKSGHLNIIQQLVERHNGLDELTPHHLSTAAEHGHLEIVKYLESKGVLYSADPPGYTPLNAACAGGHMHVIRHFIEVENRNMNGEDGGVAPLLFACHRNHLEVIEYLVVKGANVTVRDDSNSTLLIIACSKDSIEIIKYLLQDIAIPNPTCSGQSGTTKECQEGDTTGNDHGTFDLPPNVVATNCCCHLDINAKNKFGHTALYTSVQKGNKNAVKLLLDKGADSNIGDPNNMSPLMVAVSNGSVEILVALIEAGSDIGAGNPKKPDPVALACVSGAQGVLKILLQQGVDVNTRGEDGKSYLHLATKARFQDAVRLLLQKGANRKCRDHDGMTPLDVAMLEGNAEIAKILKASEDEAPSGPNLPHCEPKIVHPCPHRELLRSLQDVKSASKLQESTDVAMVRNTISNFASSVCYSIGDSYKKSTDFFECGSMSEGTRTYLPDEFDILVAFPLEYGDHNKYVTSDAISLDGYIKLDSCDPPEQFSRGFRQYLVAGLVSNLSKEDCLQWEQSVTRGDIGRSACSTFDLVWMKDGPYKDMRISMDMVPSLKMRFWPKNAITKTRLIEGVDIARKGFYIVPKCPPSNSRIGKTIGDDICQKLWRVSFVEYENYIMKNLPQHLLDVYIVAKAVRNPRISGREVDDIITSYLLKTVFLHEIDEQFLDNTFSLEEMVCILYQRLVERLSSGVLPSYFLPTCNIMDSCKFSLEETLSTAQFL